MVEIIIRFIVGGAVVSAFAVIGDVLKPKTFAGIFGAAPSVALATLGLTFALHGPAYASKEGLSMMAGALALIVYSLVLGWLLLRHRTNATVTAGASMVAWLAVALGVWGIVLR